MGRQTTGEDIMRRAAVSLLRRGLITKAEAARLAGVSRQAVQNWEVAEEDAREAYLAKLWAVEVTRYRFRR
jgi:predicted HTH domain antitoxin